MPSAAFAVRLGRVLLGLETSTNETVIALADPDAGGELLGCTAFRGVHKHEEALLPAVDALLAQVGRDRLGIRTVAVGLGPGGFTSLRVGIASAKGMALGLGAQLVGVASLRSIARGAAPTEGAVVVLSDQRKREVNGAVYAIDASGSRALLEPVHGDVDRVVALAAEALAGRSAIVVGDGARAYADALAPLGAVRLAPAIYDRPRPEAFVQEALEALARGELGSLETLEPLYVKPTDAKLPAVKLRTSL